MKILQDSYIVAVDQVYESSKTKSGVITLNQAYVDDEDEGRHANKRVYGTVLSCPASFSDTVVSLIDIGYPPAHGYTGHDTIQTKSNQGISLSALPLYYPSTFEGFETITLADVARKTDIRVGDKVYFDYNVTEPDNALGKHSNGHEMFRIQVDMIYAVVRREREDVAWTSWVNKIYMQGGWVLVEPDMEDWEDIKTPSGIYKKPSPEAKHLLGFIRHMQPRKDLKIGDKIVYINDANAPMRVEGVDYYCMHGNEVLCKV